MNRWARRPVHPGCSPAGDGVVSLDPTRMCAARGDRFERTSRRVGLPIKIVTPAGDGVVSLDPTRMLVYAARPVAGGDRFERNAGRAGLPFEVVAPGGDGVVSFDPARMTAARGDGFERTRGRVGLPITVAAPAGDGVASFDPTHMRIASGDGVEGGVALRGGRVDGDVGFVLASVQKRHQLRAGQRRVRRKRCGDVPVVISRSAAQATLSCCQVACTSSNGWSGAGGLPAKRHKNVTSCARVNAVSGENVIIDVPVVISLSTIHDTAAFWFSAVMSPKLCIGAVGWFSIFQI